jgi:hypothetical protein
MSGMAVSSSLSTMPLQKKIQKKNSKKIQFIGSTEITVDNFFNLTFLF